MGRSEIAAWPQAGDELAAGVGHGGRDVDQLDAALEAERFLAVGLYVDLMAQPDGAPLVKMAGRLGISKS